MSAALIYPFGPPRARGLLKAEPEDFRVNEILGFDADGDGEHWLLRIEKRGLSTPELVERIARECGLKPRDIGYCGLKDKHAVARQWLSLQLPGREPPRAALGGDGYRELERYRHRRKLRRGSHRGNRFRIRLGAVEALPPESRGQIEQVAELGFANYFGAQRFGSRQDNVEQALQRLGHGRLARNRRGLLISSLRSFLFNLVLARRIESDTWRQPLDGDVFMLRGSHSIFSAEIDHEILERFARLDISSCAGLYGSGDNRLRGRARQLEDEVVAAHPQITQCLEQQGARRQMRALRAVAEGFEYAYEPAGKRLNLEFTLAPGSYATSLLNHFIDCDETRSDFR